MTYPISDAEAYALYGPSATPYYLAAPIPPPAPVLQDPAMPAYDEGYAYSRFSPEAINEGWESAAAAPGQVPSSYAPEGGTINWDIQDPNGYYWVNDAYGGYWYRPQDGAVWRANDATRAEDQRIAMQNAAANVPLAGSTMPTTPITNAPVVRQRVPTKPADKFTSTAKPITVSPLSSVYPQGRGQLPIYTDADQASLDLGFSNATAAASRGTPEQQRLTGWIDYINGLPEDQFWAWRATPEGQRIWDELQLSVPNGVWDQRVNAPIGEGAIPVPRIPLPSRPEDMASMDLALSNQMTNPRQPYQPLQGPLSLASQEGEMMLPGTRINSGDDPRMQYPNWEHEMDAKGNWIPVGRPDDRSSVHPLLPSLWDIAPTQVRDKLPNFVDDALHFGLTGPGVGLGMVFPVGGGIGGGIGASGLAGRVGLNFAQDLAFGAAFEGSQKADVPTPLAVLFGLGAAATGDIAAGRALTKFGAGAAVKSAADEAAQAASKVPARSGVVAEADKVVAAAAKVDPDILAPRAVDDALPPLRPAANDALDDMPWREGEDLDLPPLRPLRVDADEPLTLGRDTLIGPVRATPEEIDQFAKENPADAIRISTANRPNVEARLAANTAPFPDDVVIGGGAVRFVDEIKWTDIGPKRLTLKSKAKNLVAHVIGDLPSGRKIVPNSAYIDPIRTAMATDKVAIEGQAKVIAEDLFGMIRKEFGNLDKNDLLPKFGVTLQDMAAHLPRYWPQLNASQRALMLDLWQWSDRNAARIRQIGRDFGQRTDIEQGGFYLPRGRATEAGMEDLPLHRTNSRGIGSSLPQTKPAGWDSMEEALRHGERYSPLKQVLEHYSRSTGDAVLEYRVAEYLKNVRDEFGNPITTTLAAGATAPRGAITIPAMASMNNSYLPVAIAKEMQAHIESLARGRHGIPVVEEINSMFRFMAATADFSWTMIQGLLMAPRNPIGWGQAMKAQFMAWGSDNVYGAAIMDFNKRAKSMKKVNRILGEAPTAEFLAGRGLRFWGPDGHEFTPQGLFGRVKDLPVYKQANRSFAVASDMMRMEAAMAHIRWKFHGLPDTATRDDALKLIDEIISGINPISGAANTRFGGDLGQFLLFAPRWLESQIETVLHGMLGVLGYAVKAGTLGKVSATSAKQDIAAQHLTAMIAFGTAATVLINEMMGNETEWNPMKRGFDGKWQVNPNFMRIRAGGKDWSIFGPWDSLLRATSTFGLGLMYMDPELLTYPLRTKASPLMSILFDMRDGVSFSGKNVPSWDWALDQFLPFSIRNGDVQEVWQEIWTEKDPIGAAKATGALGLTMLGMKSNPLTEQEAFEEELAEYEEQLKGFLYPGKGDITWSNLTPEGKDQARALGLIPPSEREGSKSDYQEKKAALEAQLSIDLDFAAKEYKRTGDVEKFKQAMRDAQMVFNNGMAELSEAYNKSKEDAKLPDDPFKRAEAQFYDLYSQARLPNKQVDWDLHDKLFAELYKSWTPAQQKFYREQIEPSLGSDRKVPKEIEQYRKDLDTYYSSGVSSAENKAQFFREYPEILAIAEEWDLSPYHTAKMHKEDEMIKKQAAIDAAFLADPDAEGAGRRWRDQTDETILELQAFKQGAASQLPDYIEDSRDPAITEYYAFKDAHRTPDGEFDYAAIDAYVARTPGLQEKLDTYYASQTQISPLIQQKREEQKVVEESGYFDLRTRAWKEEFAPAAGVTGAEGQDYYAWKNAHYSTVTGWDTPENEKLNGEFGKHLNGWQLYWIEQKPEAAALAMKWGYYTPSSNAEKKAMGIPVKESSSGSSSSSSGSGGGGGSSTPKGPTKAEEAAAAKEAERQARIAEGQKYR